MGRLRDELGRKVAARRKRPGSEDRRLLEAHERCRWAQYQPDQHRPGTGRVSPYFAPGRTSEVRPDIATPPSWLEHPESWFYSDLPPPTPVNFAHVSIKQPDSMAPQPSTLHTVSDPSILVDPESSACRRLISHSLSPHETISLIEAVFTSKAEIDIVRDLRRDDAQTFIDVVHGVRLHICSFPRLLLTASFAFDQALDLPDLSPRLRKKCLSALCKICGRQALLPRSLQIPLCYDRSDSPLYRGGYADVWKGEHRGRHVAVKVLRVYSTSDFDKITSVGPFGLSEIPADSVDACRCSARRS